MKLTEFYRFIEQAAVAEMSGEFEDVVAEDGGVRFTVDDRSFLLSVTEDPGGCFERDRAARQATKAGQP